MPTTPFATIGTKITIDNTEVEGVQVLGDPESDASAIDVTTLKDEELKNIPGLRQTSTIQLTCFKDKSKADANYEKCRALDDGNDHAVVIEFADASKLSFDARISVRLAGSSVNAAQMFYLNIFKTGDTTYTQAA